jgi:hypothetical protein
MRNKEEEIKIERFFSASLSKKGRFFLFLLRNSGAYA